MKFTTDVLAQNPGIVYDSQLYADHMAAVCMVRTFGVTATLTLAEFMDESDLDALAQVWTAGDFDFTPGMTLAEYMWVAHIKGLAPRMTEHLELDVDGKPVAGIEAYGRYYRAYETDYGVVQFTDGESWTEQVCFEGMLRLLTLKAKARAMKEVYCA